MNRLILLLALSSIVSGSPAGAQNPFAPPEAKVHYEPPRQYDLKHIRLELKLDWPAKKFTARVTQTMEMLRAAESIEFDAGPALKIRSSNVNGRPAKSEHTGPKLRVYPQTRIERGGKATVVIDYEAIPPPRGRSALNGTYGWHWVLPDRFEPRRKPGFWTQGETEGNRDWVPLYDYPNDMTTSETIVEAPAGWFVVGNGKLVSDRTDAARKRRTLHWRMTQPHVTYLLSLAGGEMDVARSTWNGIDLYYCVPRGEGHLIPASFSDTPDMLTFFTRVLGVKYPWPKYAQSAMFDFGGGMENVSATTLGEDALVDVRSGIRPMASLNSHELAHQWFGDLVTCKDWSHIWLNESFATFFQQLYTEHARGKDFYDLDREGSLHAYLGEAKRYRRPLVTRLYSHPDQLFDSHAYPKGALVLHMLRRELGDDDLFKGLRHYLNRNRYRPVDTNDLVRALQEATGRSLEAFFEQWVYKPGHPVIDYDWAYDESAKEVVITVRQLQDTKDGTPVYSLKIPYSILLGSSSGGGMIEVNAAETQIRLPSERRPDALLLDPGRDLLLERKEKKWQPGEREAVLKRARSWMDRRDAALAILADNPADPAARDVVSTALSSQSVPFVTAVLDRATSLKKASLSDLYRPLLSHQDPAVRASAVTALGHSAEVGSEDFQRIERLIHEKSPYPAVTAAITVLGERDADTYLPLLERAVAMESRHDVIRLAVLQAIGKARSEDSLRLLVRYAQSGFSRSVRRAALGLIEGKAKENAQATKAISALLQDEDAQILREVLSALGRIKDSSTLAAIRDLEKSSRDAEIRAAAKNTAEVIEKP